MYIKTQVPGVVKYEWDKENLIVEKGREKDNGTR